MQNKQDNNAGTIKRTSNYRELTAVIKPDGEFDLDWLEADGGIEEAKAAFQERFYERFVKDGEESLLFLGLARCAAPLAPSVSFLRKAVSEFLSLLIKDPDIELKREKAAIALKSEDTAGLLAAAPYMTGDEFLCAAWLEKLCARAAKAFGSAIKNFKGSAAELFASYNPDIHPAGRVFFHLVENNKGGGPFAFMATYSKPGGAAGARHIPLKNALAENGNDSAKLLKLLSAVTRASEKSAFIANLLETGEIFHPISVSAEEAHVFLKEVPVYEEAGVLCRIPNWWKDRSRRVRLKITIGSEAPSRVGLGALLDFEPELTIDGEKITADELRAIASQSSGLALLKGKWIETGGGRLEDALKAYERALEMESGGGITISEAIRFQINARKAFDVKAESGEDAIEITNGEWLDSVIKKMVRPDALEHIDCGAGFAAALRPYQQTGLKWLHLMKKLGLGACLADDMGLGKTVQMLALLNGRGGVKPEKTLLVVPASLIGNWIGEINRFAPRLKYYALHASENKTARAETAKLLKEYDLIITTYAMLHRIDWLKQTAWDSLIIDEAQNIKNPDAKQTKAVKQIRASFRAAMTGTPIENRLSDLWSIFDFLNKGLLGGPSEFNEFAARLKNGGEGYARLKNAVGPFILRRLKTDKTIISDLPDKIEMKTYSSLTKKQAAIYNSLVNEIKAMLETVEEGIKRKGLVLSSLMKFKQICNHPDQYLGQGAYREDESGKFDRLREICETIREKRERAIVFTQFKEITAPLAAFMAKIFGREGLVLHGETPVNKRKEIVAKFQGGEYSPFMVLSLKAGGVGLNLTAASHVIHFDRWWNPAVENQATDRAFRIGQSKNVVVHKFIARGTVEEKIDRIIEDKIKLSKEIIPDISESWITEMDNKRLMELFSLSN